MGSTSTRARPSASSRTAPRWGLTAKTTEDIPGHGKVEHWLINDRARALARQAGLTLSPAADPDTNLEEPPEASPPTLVLEDGDEPDPLDDFDRQLGIGPYRQPPR